VIRPGAMSSGAPLRAVVGLTFAGGYIIADAAHAGLAVWLIALATPPAC